MTTQNAALQTTGPRALTPAEQQEFDELMKDAGRGTENIGANDVRPPRLMLCQAGSPQRKPDDPKQIPGLNELDLFNSLTGENYGRSVNFAVIASLGSHYVEFDKDNNVVDREVPPNDPRTEWPKAADGSPLLDEKGRKVKPVATHFRDYLIWLVDSQEVVVLSFKSTTMSMAIKLNGLLKSPLKIADRILGNPPAWARTYNVKTEMTRDGDLSWGIFNLSQVGTTDIDTRRNLSAMADMYSKRKVEIDRTDEVINGDAAPAQPSTAGDATDM